MKTPPYVLKQFITPSVDGLALSGNQAVAWTNDDVPWNDLEDDEIIMNSGNSELITECNLILRAPHLVAMKHAIIIIIITDLLCICHHCNRLQIKTAWPARETAQRNYSEICSEQDREIGAR